MKTGIHNYFQQYWHSCAAGQVVSKYDWASDKIQNIQLTNLEMLGMPFWLACPIEQVITRLVLCANKFCSDSFVILKLTVIQLGCEF